MNKQMKLAAVAAICAVSALSSFAQAESAKAAEKIVSQETMKAIYEEVKTPYKVGMVLLPEKGEKIDNPCVFRHGDEWYMIFVVFDGKGYETHLAKSDDLVRWTRLGKVFGRAEGTCWDSAQADGWPALLDPRWDGPNTLNTFDGRYLMMYIGGHKKGYETDPLSTGVAWTDDPSAVKPWVIKHNGVVYHFYCAVGNKGRGIALATSTKCGDQFSSNANEFFGIMCGDETDSHRHARLPVHTEGRFNGLQVSM